MSDICGMQRSEDAMLVLTAVTVRVALGLGRNSGQCIATLPNRPCLDTHSSTEIVRVELALKSGKLIDHS